MASHKRIEDLKVYLEQATESLKEVEARRDQLLDWQELGMTVIESDKKGDQFSELIQDADKAVIAYQKIVTYLGLLLDRAVAGEDV